MNKHFEDAGQKIANESKNTPNYKYIIQIASNLFVFTAINKDVV